MRTLARIYRLKSIARRLRHVGYSLLLLTMFVACEVRPLEVILDEKVRVRIVAKWEVNFTPLYGTVPNGMTVMIWGSEDTAPMIRTTNADNITVKLAPDTYRLIIFNEVAEEYAPYVNFFESNSYDDMVARASTYTSRAWDSGTEYMYAPEDPRIAVALDTFVITKDMVLNDSTIFIPYEVYRDDPTLAYHESERIYEIPEVPWPMTVDLFVRVRLKHRQSLKAIEGSISGMADGFSLSKIVRSTTTGTLKFNPDNWNRNRYGEDTDSLGVITTRVASFGLPYGKELVSERDSADNLLRLNLTLTNDSVLDYTFKVGKDIHYITPEGVEARIRYRQDLQNLQLVVELPDIIDLPYVIPEGGTGFNAIVDDWDFGGTFDIGGF